jgi:PKD repeat protein
MKKFYTLTLFASLLFLSLNLYSQFGQTCLTPHAVISLPFYQTGLTTALNLNTYTSADACGSSYMDGNDYVFSYTPLSDVSLNITLSNTGLGVGLFVVDDCPDQITTTCMYLSESVGGNPSISNVYLTAFHTYYFLVSTNNLFNMNPSTAFDISIEEVVNVDGGVIEILSPVSSCSLTSSEIVSVYIQNFGIDQIYNFDVYYSLNGGVPVMETIEDTIYSGEIYYFEFSIPVNLSVQGSYELEVYTLISGDGDNSNDTYFSTIANSEVLNSFPYSEDFEAGNGGWYAYGDNSSWELGSPAATLINYAYSGNSAWVTNLYGNHNVGEVSYVEGPCFDLSTISNPVIELSVWYETINVISGANIEVSTDGINWDILYAGANTSNWYNMNNTWSGSSGGWLIATNTLEMYAGFPVVKFRVAFNGGFITSAEGFAFDDIKVYDCNLPAPVAEFDFIMTDLTVVFINNSQNASSYSWDFGEFMATSTESDPVHTYLAAGTYDVMLIAYNACGNDTVYQTIDVITSVPGLSESLFQIYPNPVRDIFIVATDENINSVSILDLTGKVIVESNGNSSSTIINMQNVSNGMYIIKIKTDSGIYFKSVIKE